MEIKTDVSLSNFRTETRAWLELNCPESMRQPINDPSDLYWGGRNAKFKSEDQRLWLKECLKKSGLSPIGKLNMVEVVCPQTKIIF